MEELQILKRDFTGALEQLSDELRSNFEDATKSSFKNLNDKIDNLGGIRCAASKPKPVLKPVPSTVPTPPEASRSTHSKTSSEKHTTHSKHSNSKTYFRKKSLFLQKPKILYVGDSIAQNVNFAYLERETSSRIKTSKAYSAIKDSQSRFPNKNVTDVAKEALANTHEADAFTHVVLGAPSVDITNMDTSKLIDSDSIEVYKQNVFLSCQNIFTVAENIIRKHPKLEKVIITDHAQRFDIPDVTQLDLSLNLLVMPTPPSPRCGKRLL